MNWIDLLILGIISLSMVVGIVRGLVGEIISLFILIASCVAATMLATPVANSMLASASLQAWLTQITQTSGIDPEHAAQYMAIGIAFGLIFIVVSIVGMLVRALFSSILQPRMLGVGNRIMGGGFGLARGYIINTVIIFIVQMTPYSESVLWDQSRVVQSYEPAVAWLKKLVMPTIAQLKQKVGV